MVSSVIIFQRKSSPIFEVENFKTRISIEKDVCHAYIETYDTIHCFSKIITFLRTISSCRMYRCSATVYENSQNVGKCYQRPSSYKYAVAPGKKQQKKFRYNLNSKVENIEVQIGKK